MRKVEASDGKPIRLTATLRARLKSDLINWHKKALDNRTGVETIWRTALRMYQGTPESKRWLPFANAPHIEVTIGALGCDNVYAQAIDLIFQVKPPLTIRSRKEQFDKHGEAFQDLVNWGVDSGKWRFRSATKEGLLDCVQLGPMVFYIPWMKTVRKTDTNKITNIGPAIYALAPEHFIIPAESGSDIQTAQFCTMRKFMAPADARLASSLQGWELDEENSSGTDSNAVENDRRMLSGAGTETTGKRPIPIGYTWAYYDIDEDGIDEDVEIIWNMATGAVRKITWNRWDCRPFIMANFQDRAHVPYGIGVMEMMAPYEQEITEIHNNRIWNMMMRNTQMYTGPESAMSEVMEIYPGKYIPNDGGPIVPMPMGTSDNTPVQAEALTESLAQRRVGVNELAAASRLGGRTPGITALSALQQANRRFTPAFDNMRYAVAGAIAQCLYRIQEQLRGGKDKEDVASQLKDILGEEKAGLVIELCEKKDTELLDALDIQLTASSVSVNRESDRQNMVMLAGLYEKYVMFIEQMVPLKASHQFKGVPELVDKAVESVNRFMLRILRTFDQVSDVEGYLLDVTNIEAAQIPGMPPEVAQAMQGQQNGAPPQGPPPGQPLQ